MRWQIAFAFLVLLGFLGLALFSDSMQASAGEVLLIVDDDGVVLGVPDKGSIDAGGDTNVGPAAHPTLGLLERLQALGHNVTVRDDGPSSAADLLGKNLVVISSSVG